MNTSRVTFWTVSVLVMVLLFSGSCFAGEYNFANTMKFVDSNSYTYIGKATKDSNTNYGEVKILNIYKADGSSSGYQQVYARATTIGIVRLVTKGSWYNLTLPSSYRTAGSKVGLYCMGHDPSLDCKITGYWNVH